jgi:DNA-binding NarL/FixJ family response regulator
METVPWRSEKRGSQGKPRRGVAAKSKLKSVKRGTRSALPASRIRLVKRTREQDRCAIKILIADDHPVVRRGLRAILESEPDLLVVAEAEDGLSTVELAKQHQPDVLIVDMLMPGINGTEVTRRVKELLPESHILILSRYSDESYILQALKNGAHGYALKNADSEELTEAVRKAHKGQLYLSSPINQERIKLYLRKGKERSDAYNLLTDREREVLHLAAQGETNVKIAEILNISPRTVEAHRNNLMRKLGIHSMTELVKYAIKRGIIHM